MDPAAPLDPELIPPQLRDGARCEALAEEFGTPLFVYDEDALAQRFREYARNFGPGNVTYAGKAFLCTAVARLVAEEGLRLDVATGGELHVALHAGFPADRLVLHGNNKSDDELRTALDAGAGRIVADSFDELDRLERLAAGRPEAPAVLVRVTPGVEAHTHEYIETGTEVSKFGFSVATGAAGAAVARVHGSPVLDFAGLHCHIGSQVFRLDSYARAIEVIGRVIAEIGTATGATVAELNVGGGLGARYLTDDPEIAVADYAKTLRVALEEVCAVHHLDPAPRLTVEPGRSIVAAAAITLYRVGTVKEIPGVATYVAVDGGMSDNPRPVLYGAGYEAYLPGRLGDERPLVCNVAGKHCEQGDVIVTGAHLPADVQLGDLLATPTTGAYGYSMASNYNKVPRPAVVFVRDGEARVVVRRESADDLVRLDAP